MSKKAGAKKGKAGKSGAAPKASKDVRLAEHPRARHQIQMAKSYAGLGAFALAGYAAWHGGGQFVDVAARALMWGTASYVIVWAMAVHVWRHIAVAEVRAAERRWEARRDAEREQVLKLTAALEENGLPTSGAGAMPPQ